MVQTIPFAPIPRPAKDLIDGFRALVTSTVGNVLDDLGIGGIILNIKPLIPGMKFVGPAFTVKEVTGAFGSYSAAEFGLGRAVDGADAGDVVAIDNGGQQVSTWGGVASYAAHKRGIAGLVVDGGIRDADEIREIGFPAFSRHVVPLSGKTRVKIVEIGGVVKIDGVKVTGGDILLGDGSGIVCIPLAAAAEVLQA